MNGWIALVVASLLTWVCVVWRTRQGRPFLPQEPSQLPRIGVIDVLFLFMALTGADVLASRWTLGGLPPEQLRELSLEQRLAFQRTALVLRLVVWVVAVAWLAFIRATPAARQRWWSRLPADLANSVPAFLLLIPPVLLIQATLTCWFPYEHPTIDWLRSAGWSVFGIAALSAGLIAPLVEELLFRGFLMRWLARFASGQVPTDELIWGELERPHGMPNEQPSKPILDDSPLSQFAIDTIAITGSAAVFSLMHYGQGAAWVALFFLGLGLGWFSTRTGRITIAILVHVMLNALTLAQLALEIRNS